MADKSVITNIEARVRQLIDATTKGCRTFVRN